MNHNFYQHFTHPLKTSSDARRDFCFCFWASLTDDGRLDSALTFLLRTFDAIEVRIPCMIAKPSRTRAKTHRAVKKRRNPKSCKNRRFYHFDRINGCCEEDQDLKEMWSWFKVGRRQRVTGHGKRNEFRVERILLFLAIPMFGAEVKHPVWWL